MISKRAVRAYLNRKLEDHRWLKRLPSSKLDEILAEVGFRQAHPKPLRKHQKVSIILGIAYPRFAFYLDMGTGKTRVALELLNFYWQNKILTIGLILLPSEEGVWSWEDQIREWGVKIPYIALGNSPSAEKAAAIAELEAGVIIATYPGLTALLSIRVKKKKGPGNELKPDDKKCRKLATRLSAFVADESTKLGNHQSLIHWIADKLSKNLPIFYALAGRPFGRDPHMLWAQQYLVDRGETLGETLGLFREAYFSQKPGRYAMYDYKFKRSMKPKLRSMIAHRSIAYSAGECLDLPPVELIRDEVSLPEAADAYYEKAIKEIRRSRGDFAVVRNTFLRMRQMSSGFIGYKDDETGEKAQLVFPTNPKLDRLIERLTEIPNDRKAVVFHEFTFSGRLICQRLKEAGITYGWVWGGAKDTASIIRTFKRQDSPMQVLLANHRLGSMVHNWQVANYEFFYESPVDVISREQAERRCFRDGQELPGFLYDLLCRGTVDERILEFHAEGRSLWDGLRRDPLKTLKIRA